jgi:CHASE2 domain-containing sensor protein
MVVGFLALLGAAVLTKVGAFSDLDHEALDAQFRIRGVSHPSHQIAIVAVDQNTLAYLNTRPPIDRHTYAQVLDVIRASEPKAVAIDVQFIGRTSADEDSSLIQAVERDGPVILATHEGPNGPIAVPAGQAQVQGAVLASAAIDVDADNVVRHMLLAPVALKTFAVRIAESYLGHPVSENAFHQNKAWIDFQGPAGTFPTYSLLDVIQGNVPAAAFRGKIVLIGVTDPVEDIFVTAASSRPMAGVELQANAVQTVLNGFPLRSMPGPLVALTAILLVGIPCVLILRFPGLVVAAMAIGVGVLFAIATHVAFDSGWIVPVMVPLTALLLALIGCVAADSFVNARQRRELEKTLGSLLPPESPAPFFISYRREHDEWAARDIRKELAKRFGDDRVFLDKRSIGTGEEWPERLMSATRWCSVLLVIIGPRWLEEVDGHRRIDDPGDWVRLEIQAVLRRPDAIVIPVLLGGARCPGMSELPEAIAGLAERQAFALSGEDLDSEISALVTEIEHSQVRISASTKTEPYADASS